MDINEAQGIVKRLVNERRSLEKMDEVLEKVNQADKLVAERERHLKQIEKDIKAIEAQHREIATRIESAKGQEAHAIAQAQLERDTIITEMRDEMMAAEREHKARLASMARELHDTEVKHKAQMSELVEDRKRLQRQVEDLAARAKAFRDAASKVEA